MTEEEIESRIDQLIREYVKMEVIASVEIYAIVSFLRWLLSTYRLEANQ